MSKLGIAVRTLRKRKALTQGQLALYAHVDQSYISQIENGHVESVGGDILVRLASHLGTTTDYLLGLTQNPSPTEADLQLTELEYRILQLFRLLPTWLQDMMIRQLRMWVDNQERLPIEGFTGHNDPPRTRLHPISSDTDNR